MLTIYKFLKTSGAVCSYYTITSTTHRIQTSQSTRLLKSECKDEYEILPITKRVVQYFRMERDFQLTASR